MEPLQSRTCTHCGAALPARTTEEKTVTCAYCGTTFALPKTDQPSNNELSASGQVVIQSGQDVHITGDVIGGNRIVVNQHPRIFSRLKSWIRNTKRRID
jgi:uncharacterized Zn-finger protein